MRKFTKKQLTEKASELVIKTGVDEKGKPITENFIDVHSEIYATEDGNFFAPEDKNKAFNHASSYRCEWFVIKGNGKPGKVQEEAAEKELRGLRQLYKQLTNRDAGNTNASDLRNEIENLRKKIAEGKQIKNTNSKSDAQAQEDARKQKLKDDEILGNKVGTSQKAKDLFAKLKEEKDEAEKEALRATIREVLDDENSEEGKKAAEEKEAEEQAIAEEIVAEEKEAAAKAEAEKKDKKK